MAILGDSTFMVESFGSFIFGSIVINNQRETRNQIRGLASAGIDIFKIILGIFEEYLFI